MAVVGVPGWIGQSAVGETGQRWMADARVALRLPATGWMSDMAGRSKESIIYINTADHNYNYIHLQNELFSRGTTPVRIEVTQHLASYSTGAPLFNFPAELQNEYIHLYITSNVMGRGGEGGKAGSREGKPGGNCINNWIGGRLRIDNRGAICGGGGGGGSVAVGGGVSSGGSGGRPLGLGGVAEGRDKQDGANASYDSPGPAIHNGRYNSTGGAGGEVGSAGGGGIAPGGQSDAYPGGAAGWAVAGTAPTWINRGNVYGPST
ncbi:putative tail fiber protein [Yersinia phage JC221]|nr:putative tail fiber protein [Yersinia phage JC221]